MISHPQCFEAGIEIYESKLVKKLYLSTTLKNQDQNFSVILGTVLWGISFHAEVVFGLGKDLLSKSGKWSEIFCLTFGSGF